MTPRNNRRKRGSKLILVSEDPPSPIIFLQRNIRADTRLTVFKQEFHLHSSGRKYHSNYFRKFLDSVDKQPAPANATFKYDYRSVIDEDGSWALMPAVEEVTDELLALVDQPEEEIECFRKLLCAIHTKSYTIQDTDQLSRLTRLADYYCALPVVSGTLTGALLRSPMFTILKSGKKDAGCECQKEARTLLVLTRKLRHQLLFKECLIHTVTSWDNDTTPPEDPIKQDKELHNLVMLKLGALYASIAKAQQGILAAAFRDCDVTCGLSIGDADFDLNDVTHSVRFFRKFNCTVSDPEHYPNFDDANTTNTIISLLKNNLTLDWTGDEPGEEGIYKRSFLCTDIEDDEYPWDLEEIDW
ncbi:hypothetical protein SBOR_7015 [Sclerotinia borealis F-4128]|uniref:BTB domain-containing protein n=1 Tax=Sclerotinia borealis (strain F-4128) TaxID=1432307 RepID=W9C9W8_SCLBF|nr:hypothetical protein SBOR_7015 [Sclerotinia borealis F-4128]